MQEMMTEELGEKMPGFHETEDASDEETYVTAHWFSVATGWDWFGIEYDEGAREVYGLVSGFEVEFGYFSLDEFEQVNESKGYEVIERDTGWTPITVRELKDRYGIMW